jgi:LEA14-like dessication related protein
VHLCYFVHKLYWMKIWTLSALLACLLMACAAPKAFEYRDLRNVKLDKVGFDKTTLNMELVYFNPNKFGLELKKIDADVYIDNHYLGKMILDTSMHIPKNQEFILPSKIAIDLKGLYKNALNLMISNEVLVSVKGTTKVGKAGMFKTVPFTYEARHQMKLF